jgi:hypothetical protein
MRRLLSALATVVASVLLLLGTGSAKGQIVFQDNFDDGFSGANWTTNLSDLGTTDTSVDYAYDYANIGIPPAPRSNGTTIGMRFLVNQSTNTFQGISASPTGQTFTGDFVLRFDAWLNYVGPFPNIGDGGTQMMTFGWGTNGFTTQWAASNHSIVFAADGDGDQSTDIRVYRAAGGSILTPDTGVYAAGFDTNVRDNTHPYYASFGSKTAPDAQLADYPEQSGTTAPGTLGMAWHDITVSKSGNLVNWTVDGTLFASVSIDGVTLGGDNIFFGMFDPFIGSSTSPNNFLNAAIFDNIEVQLVPEPSSAVLLGFAAAGAAARRRRKPAHPPHP